MSSTPYHLREYTFIAKVTVSKRSKGATYRITIPKNMAELMNLEQGDYVHVQIRRMELKKAKKERGE